MFSMKFVFVKVTLPLKVPKVTIESVEENTKELIKKQRRAKERDENDTSHSRQNISVDVLGDVDVIKGEAAPKGARAVDGSSSVGGEIKVRCGEGSKTTFEPQGSVVGLIVGEGEPSKNSGPGADNGNGRALGCGRERKNRSDSAYLFGKDRRRGLTSLV